MITLNISIKNRIAKSINDVIVCGNSGYVINFTFDDEWESYNVKTARFIYNGNAVDVVFSGNSCPVPVISNATTLAVGVFVGDLRTTTPALIACKKSILCEDGLPPDPPPEVYKQIMDMLNTGGGTGNGFTTDETLTLKNGVLSVNTTEKVEADNKQPVTSAAVAKAINEIEERFETLKKEYGRVTYTQDKTIIVS